MQTMTHIPEIETFSNEDVQVSLFRKPACKIELQVAVSKNMIDKARSLAIKSVKKEVVLPGFRKGKAPENFILSKYSGEIEKSLHKELADLAFVASQRLVKVPVLNQRSRISFDLKKIAEDSAELTFTFETEPKVPSVDPKLFIPQEVNQVEVGEKQVSEAIRQMAFFYAEWQLIEDRGVQEGDFIIIDLDTVEGDTVQRVFNGVRFEVVSERMAEWMRNLVLGAKVGETLEGMSTPDDSATEEEKKVFLPKKVKVHLLKVERAVLPAIDDEFAKKVGAQDVAGMHEMVLNVLKSQVEDKAQEELRAQVSQFLVRQYEFELPQSMIDEEKQYRMNQALASPKFAKDWAGMSVDQKHKIEAKIVKEATEALRLFYLSRQVVADAKIPMTQKEVQERAIETRRERTHGQGGAITQEEYALALSAVFLTKAQDFIIDAQKA